MGLKCSYLQPDSGHTCDHEKPGLICDLIDRLMPLSLPRTLAQVHDEYSAIDSATLQALDKYFGYSSNL